MGRLRSARYRLKASQSVPLFEQSALQRAVAELGEYANNAAIRFGFAAAPFIGAAAVIASLLATGRSWWFALVMAALGGIVGWAAAVGLVLLFAFIRAPGKQRDEARRYAKAVEAQVADYREWAARQQIARDFFDNELQRANAVEYNLQHFSLNDQAEQWKVGLRGMEAQLRARGGGDYSGEVGNVIRAFDAKDDGYGDDEQRRLKWAMRTGAHNLWTLVRQEQQPAAPARPGELA